VSTPSLESPLSNAGRELAFRDNARGFSLTLKRNCSISPAALACVFAALGALALAIGAGFALAGAWLILPFAGLEIVALAAAFVMQARHATDYERIDLEGERLRLEVAQADALARYELDARRVRIHMDGHYVVLRGPREELEVGRHIDAPAREALATELKKRLRI
jgi:uncharacterized membrane protein